MIDIKRIRENPEAVAAGLAAKNQKISLEPLIELDSKRRAAQTQSDAIKNARNALSKEIGQLMAQKKDAADKMAQSKVLAEQIKVLDADVAVLEGEIQKQLLVLPNTPHASVPSGRDASANQEIKKWGTLFAFDFKPLPHWDLAENLGIVDLTRATKITGSHFVLYRGWGARLERALIAFMLDMHTQKHGYVEVSTPFIVNRASMTATGQLPKMEADMYRLEQDDLFLIPTAEVPVTNIHRDDILDEAQLPIYYAAYSPCFRREAGSYGKDTRGMTRVHQFDKVEMVKFVKPETSYDELEKLLANAEAVLQALEIPYRVLLLCAGDMSFAAAKCYDIEAWSPGQNAWLEVSSCSNFEDFQARRGGIRFRRLSDSKKVEFVHTLNGSGIALARTFIAILENYQNKDGSITIPKALRPYLDGQEKITGIK